MLLVGAVVGLAACGGKTRSPVLSSDGFAATKIFVTADQQLLTGSGAAQPRVLAATCSKLKAYLDPQARAVRAECAAEMRYLADYALAVRCHRLRSSPCQIDAMLAAASDIDQATGAGLEIERDLAAGPCRTHAEENLALARRLADALRGEAYAALSRKTATMRHDSDQLAMLALQSRDRIRSAPRRVEACNPRRSS
jgi:hypothetical protein